MRTIVRVMRYYPFATFLILRLNALIVVVRSSFTVGVYASENIHSQMLEMLGEESYYKSITPTMYIDRFIKSLS